MSDDLPKIFPPRPLSIPLSPLTPSSFAPFGTLITAPIPQSLNTIPSTPPTPLHPAHQPSPVLANQNTAVKTSPISPLTNNYPPPSSDQNRPESRANIALFSCFPRQLPSNRQFAVTILERHPYTTQTFSPLGLSTPSSAEGDESVFIVIVAPSLPTSQSHCSNLTPTSRNDNPNDVTPVQRPPDLSRLHAFIGRGDMAVTYGVGTWHAPMVVIGKRRVDFVVTQFVNGTTDDCEEVEVGEGVSVDLSGLELAGDEAGTERGRERGAKL